MDFQQAVKILKQQVSVSEYLSKFLTVIKKGHQYVAQCPFHQDKRPSLAINNEKQIFKCFPCGAGGDIFAFERRYYHQTTGKELSYGEAVRRIATAYGIELSGRFEGTQVDHQSYDCWGDVVRYCQYLLSEYPEVTAYLQKRGIKASLIEKYQIGYDDGKVKQFLQDKGYPFELYGDRLGLVHYHEYRQDYIDAFEQRIIFPIHDHQGRVVGVSARIFPEQEEMPKYKLSKQSAIFHKSSLLFNYHHCRGKEELYLVEGVFDALALISYGVTNVVATLGTAVTQQHQRLLQKLQPRKIYLAYDQDVPGQMATYRVLIQLLGIGMEVGVLWHQGNEDPSALAQHPTRFRAFLQSALTPEQFIPQHLRSLQTTPQQYQEAMKLLLQLPEGQQRRYQRIVKQYQQSLKDQRQRQLVAQSAEGEHDQHLLYYATCGREVYRQIAEISAAMMKQFGINLFFHPASWQLFTEIGKTDFTFNELIALHHGALKKIIYRYSLQHLEKVGSLSISFVKFRCDKAINEQASRGGSHLIYRLTKYRDETIQAMKGVPK